MQTDRTCCKKNYLKQIAIFFIIIICLLLINVEKIKATEKTATEGLNYVAGLVGTKVGTGQCVALIKKYYEYLGVSAVSGNACDYANNSLPSGWKRVQGGVPQAGDILVYTGATYGHIVIYAGGTTVYQQNWSGKYVEKTTNWNYNKSWYSDAEGGTKSYWGYIRPNYLLNLTAPTNVKWTDQNSPTPNSVTISWDKVSGATSYNVLRRKKVSGTTTEYGTVATNVKETSYTDTGLETAQMYYYKIVAVNGSVTSARSDPALRVWTMSKAPTCTALSSTSVKVSWESVEFAETYRIDRRVAVSGSQYSTIKTGIPKGTTSFTDTGLEPNTEYYYRVYPVASSDNDNITVRSETSAKVKTKATYILNLNGYLGTDNAAGNISGYGTADVYLNGQLVKDDVTDFYQSVDAGTTYEIKDIKTASGKYYYGVTGGSLTGTLTQDTVVQLHFGTMCTDGTQSVANGQYVIASAMDRTKVLDVAGAGTVNATNLQLSTYRGISSQVFTVTYQGGGYYSITDTNSGLSIHAQGSGTTNGTNVHMWNSATGINGQWVIKSAGNGYYNIITHCSSMYLDVTGANTADGTNIQIYTGNGTNAQKFALIPYYYTVTYNANGGSWVPASQTKIYGRDLTISETVPIWDGYTFKGWATSATGAVAYAAGDTYKADAAITLYAVWEQNTGITLNLANLTRVVGETYTLTATVTGSGAGSQGITWSSTDSNIVSVDSNGKLTALAVGTATVTATAGNGAASASCVVTVRAADTLSLSSSRTIPDGTYKIRMSGSSYVLSPSGENICIWEEAEEDEYQQFIFEYVSDGYYYVTNAGSGERMSVSGGNNAPGTNIEQGMPGQADSQLWQPVEKNGLYYLTPKCAPGKVADVEYAVKANGTNVSLWVPKGGTHQLFELVLCGEKDTEAPVVTGGYLSDVSATGCKYNVTATDNLGVDHVDIHLWCGQWTEEGDTVYQATQSDGTWSCEIPLDLSNGENWIMDARVYDAAGNQALTEDGQTTACAVMRKVDVSLDSNGGDCQEESVEVYFFRYTNKLDGEETYYLAYGELPVPVYPWHIFKGWYYGDALVTKDKLVTELEDHTLTAQWMEVVPDMVLPGSLEEIGEEAFAGMPVMYVQCPEALKKIGARAFAGCSDLREIYIPEGTTGIAADAFEGCGELTILGVSGSYAEFYALRNGYAFYNVDY